MPDALSFEIVFGAHIGKLDIAHLGARLPPLRLRRNNTIHVFVHGSCQLQLISCPTLARRQHLTPSQ